MELKERRRRITATGVAVALIAVATFAAWVMSQSAAAGASATGGTPGRQAAGSPAQGCAPAWHVVPSQNVGTGSNRLTAVEALPNGEVWAAGYYTGTGRDLTLVQRWDGAAWSIVPSPNPGTYNNHLSGITAVGTNDLWAVGDYNFDPAHPTRHLLTIHWTGSQWDVVPNPDPGGNYDNALSAVQALAPDNVWTVSYYRRYSPQRLTMRWDGSQWIHVQEAGLPYPNGFGDLDAYAPDNIWEVGSANNNTFVERWDGQTWITVPSPAISNTYDVLMGVAVVTPGNVWAVGGVGPFNSYVSLVVHCTTGGCDTYPTPNVGLLTSVEAT